jgi:hypothetical protein
MLERSFDPLHNLPIVKRELSLVPMLMHGDTSVNRFHTTPCGLLTNNNTVIDGSKQCKSLFIDKDV